MADDGARGAEAQEFARLRVYIVDDSRTQAEIARGLLEHAGHQVQVNNSSVAALAEIPRERPDCVLMDIMMPELDGVETTKRIRKQGGDRGEIPIVALTAHAMKGDREDYLAAGMDGYVSKPIRGRELFAALKPYLSDDGGEEAVTLVAEPLVAVR